MLNPFRGLDRPREVWAWGMYDLANQSFQLLINTLLFAVFLSKVVASDPKQGDQAWIVFVGVAMLLAVIVSPLVGAIADARAWKKKLLIGTGLIASACTAALALLQPGQIWLAGVLYITAAFCVNLGENFLGSFLPELARPDQMGRVSATGWTMSYVGALLLLAIVSVMVFSLGLTDPKQWRWVFVMAGAWFFLGMLPAILLLKERATPRPAELRRGLFAETFGQLLESARQTRRYRQLARFLGVFFIYSLGSYTVIFYAGKIGDRLGFQIQQLTLLALLMAATAGIAAVITGKYQDKVGHRRTIMLALVVWIASTLGLAALAVTGAGRDWFWLVAGGVGIGLGAIGTSSRALVGAFTPPERAGEFFGLWGMVFKLAGVVGPATFGAISLRGQTVGLFVLAGFFVLGLVLMLRIDEREGMAAARNGPGHP